MARASSLSPKSVNLGWARDPNETQNLVNFKITHDLDGLRPEPTMWSYDTAQRIPFWKLAINHNMDVQYQRSTYGNGAALLFFTVWRLAYGRTYEQPNFLRLMGYRSLAFGAQELRCYQGKRVNPP